MKPWQAVGGEDDYCALGDVVDALKSIGVNAVEEHEFLTVPLAVDLAGQFPDLTMYSVNFGYVNETITGDVVDDENEPVTTEGWFVDTYVNSHCKVALTIAKAIKDGVQVLARKLESEGHKL